MRAVGVVAGLWLLRARRGRTLYLAAAIMGLPVVAAAVALASGAADSDLLNKILEAELRVVIPLCMLMLASAAVAEEVQERTLTYLLTRPIPRWSVPVGKLLGAAAVTLLLLSVTLPLSYLLCLATDPPEIAARIPLLLRSLGAGALAVALFGALCATLGSLVTGHPQVVTLVVLLAVELGLASVPGATKAVAMTVHLRNLAGLYRPNTSYFVADPAFSWVTSLAVVVAVTCLWITLLVLWVQRREYAKP